MQGELGIVTLCTYIGFVNYTENVCGYIMINILQKQKVKHTKCSSGFRRDVTLRQRGTYYINILGMINISSLFVSKRQCTILAMASV